MSKFKKEKVLPRYTVVAVLLTLVGFVILGKAFYIMTVKKDYWTEVASNLKRDSVSVKPNRGNILSCDGQLMASSIPEYKLFMDFQAGDPLDTAWSHKRDTLWNEQLDSLCEGLHEIFPQRSAEEFRSRLEEGRHKVITNSKTGAKTVGARHWAVWPRRVDYSTYCEVKKLPFFCLPTNKGGFHYEKFEARRRPFTTLAERTIGDIRSFEGGNDTARFGIELAYDTILRGHNGYVHHQKVLNKYMDITVTPPEDGADIVTTIDVGMQDLAERALIEEMKLPEVNADLGVVILMEVKTGDVKAIVNMRKCDDGKYRELYNDAISHRCEPGSVFKVASFLVALDDGVADTSFIIPTGSGVMEMHGRLMKDHNWRRGGYQNINMARSLEVSSNVGVSYVIDKFYGSKPEEYVKGLYRVGIGEDLQLPLSGYLAPQIRMPDTKTTNRALYWSKTTLPWMSIGYETQIAPINTVTFYNAIANNGKMVRPRFVKRVVKDGQVLKESKPEVIKEHIAKPKTIETMQTILEHVVSQGLGKKAGSRSFKVAGKTGTAQIADEKGGYHSGITRYWLSFCGYFPADDPRYTCIVCLKKSGLPASGGGMSGVVFHNIAEGVMAKNLKMRVEDARDTASILVPDVKNGNVLAADYVLSELGVRTFGGWNGAYAQGAPIWGKARREPTEVQLAQVNSNLGYMPDVRGMGARDAVYMLEQRGVRVKLQGTGHIKSQSIPEGKRLQTGMTCELHLE